MNLNKKLSYTMQDNLMNQKITLELERSTQLLNNSIQECGRLKQELYRFKGLHEETAHKTQHMKVHSLKQIQQDSINRLVAEIDKLNDLINNQDERILMDRQTLESTAQQLVEQKQEKCQLLNILHSFQNDRQSTGSNGAPEYIQQYEKEISSIKQNYEQLTEMHAIEIFKQQEEINQEKKKNEKLEQELRQMPNDKRVQGVIEKLEKQMIQMGNLLAQKQAEIDILVNNPDLQSQIEELQGQVQHFKDLRIKTQLEFNQFRRRTAEREPQANDEQIQALKLQLAFLEEQTNILRESHDDEQINNLLTDLSNLKQENLKLKDMLSSESSFAELTFEVKRLKERERDLENQVKAGQVQDDRLNNLLSVVQSLQQKNEQLQQYLNQDQLRMMSPLKSPKTSMHRSQNFFQTPNTVTVRKQINTNQPSQQALPVHAYSPLRQVYHGSNPSISLRGHHFPDAQQQF